MSLRSFIQKTQLLLEQGLYESRRAWTPLDDSLLRPIEMTALEERILMSASPAAVAADTADAAAALSPEAGETSLQTSQQLLDIVADSVLPQSSGDDHTGETTEDSAAQTSTENAFAGDTAEQTRELVFIDESVTGIDQMIADLKSESAQDESRTLEIVVLDSERDGIAQITSSLLQYHGIDGIHVVSHGSNGQVQLGSTSLSLQNLDTYRSAISAWQHSMSDKADLLFYGCNLAATGDGRELMNQIAAACDCDVAASEDLTGHADLGGDWDLEYAVGLVSTETAFSATLESEWISTLDTANLNPTQDTYIDSGNDGNNFGASTSLTVDKSGGDIGDVRALFQFDVSAIPVGATINSATLQLNATSNDGAFAVNVYELTQSWSEGSQTGNNGTANWDDRHSGTSWSSPGGTYNSTIIATSNTAALGSHTWDITTLVQAWHSGTKTNNGLILGSPEGGGSKVTYDSREGAIPPVLVIDYDTPIVANDDSANTTLNTAVVIDVDTNDTINAPATAIIDVAAATGGTVINNGDGTVTYTPGTDYVGSDTFDYVQVNTTDTVSYWRLDGDATDAVGSNIGTITGASTVAGRYGDALSFDETDDQVVVSDFAFTDSFSVSFQLKVDDNTGSDFQYIYSHGDINSTNSLNVLLVEDSHPDAGTLRTVIRDTNDTLDNTALDFSAGSIVGDGQWHTYTLTVDSVDGARVYLDGTLQNTDATRGGDAFNPATDVYLGTRQDLDPNRRYGGSLDSVQIFDRALSDSEVGTLHTGGTALATVSVTVTNSSPANTVPGAQTTSEDSALVFNTANGNLITIADDAGAVLTVSANVSNGTLTLSQITGLVFENGSNGSSSMTVTGTVENINAALDGLTYNPTGNFNGSDTLTVSTADNTIYEFNIDAGLLGYYEFNSASPGSDSSPGGGNTATLIGSAGVSSDATRGDVLSLNGSTDYAQINSDFSQPASVTASAWVNGNSAYSEVISFNNRLILRFDDVNSSAGVSAIYHDGTTYRKTSSGTFLAGTGWHHLAMSFDDATKTLTLYIDGAVAAQNTFTDSISYIAGDTYIGSNTGASLFFNGLIDDARIYNRVLSDTEISNMASAPPIAADSDSVAVTVNAVNDAPTVGGGSLAAISEDNTNPPGDTVSSLFGSSFNDVDGGSSMSGIAVTSNNAPLSEGTWQYSTDGGSNWFAVGAVDGANSLALSSSTRIRFLPATDFSGSATVLSLRALDNTYAGGFTSGASTVTTNTGSPGGSSPISSSLVSLSQVVTAQNDAPVIDLNGSDGGGTGFSTTFTEGGGRVSVTDTDATITDVDHAIYQQLTITLGSFADGTSEEIRMNSELFSHTTANTIVTTVGTTNFNIAFSGTAFTITRDGGGTIPQTDLQLLLRSVEYENTSSNPTTGNRTFSFVAQDGSGLNSTAAVSTIAVSATNTRPTLTSFAGTVDTTAEDTEVEVTFAELAAQGNETDTDGSVTAFVVKSVPAGSLRIGTTAGTATAYAAGTNDVIDGTRHAYWTPALNTSGTTNAFTVVARDDGGLESIGNIAAQVVVTPVNDAPTVGGGSLAAISEDNTNPPGDTVSSLFGSSFNDVDSGSSMSGIAVTSNNAPLSEGTWQYSTDGGSNWFAVGAVDGANSLALSSSTRIRFLPATDFSGSATVLSLRALDNTYAGGFTSGASTVTTNTGSPGGSSPISSSLVSLSQVVTAQNDAPVIDLNGSDGGGTGFSTTFTEGGSRVSVTDTDATITDVDHAIYQQLTITLGSFADGTSEEIRMNSELFSHTTANTIVTTVGTTNFNIAFSGTAFTITRDGGGTIPQADLQLLLRSVEYENTSSNPTTGNRTFSFVAQDGSGLNSTAAVSTIAVSATNTRPTLTSFAGTVDTTAEDTEVEVTFAELAAQGNETDTDGSVTAFVVKSVPAGSLRIGTTAGTATAYAAGTNDVIDGTRHAYWTPALNTSGTTNAFTVVARDDGGLESIGNIAAQVVVTPVNDAPVLTNTFTGGSASEGSGHAVFSGESLSDIDSTDFNGGTLTVTITSSPDPGSESLYLASSSGVTTSGSNVLVSGTTVGTMSGGTGGTPLVISLNANATVARTEAVFTAVAIGNFQQDPVTGARTIEAVITDGDGGTSNTVSDNVSFTATNDAPVLDNSGNLTFTTISEDNTNNSGNTIAQIIASDGGDRITDVDGSGEGIAVFAVNSGNGTWQYSTNGGTIWNNVGSVSTTSALLLRDTDRMRFVPDGLSADSASVSFHAWDQSTGTAGSTADTTTGSTAFSSASDSATITVTAVNDAPVLGNNAISILEGGSVTLSAASLNATDIDNADAGLTFSVSGISGGQFELTSAPQTAITSFTQAQVTASQVIFVHDGSESAPAYSITVSDGSDSDGPHAAGIVFTRVNDAPLLTALGGESVTVFTDGVPVAVDSGSAATLMDSDLPSNYNGGYLQVTGQSFFPADQIRLDTSGVVSLSAGFTDGSGVSISGLQIGTLTGTSSSTMRIALNASATAAHVNQLLQNVTFSTTSTSLGNRTVEFVFNDGDGTANGGADTSNTESVSIWVAQAGNGLVTTSEDTAYTFVATDFDFTGVTGTDLQNIEILTLPSNGTLNYNGSAATIGQTVSKADIDGGLLQFVPDPNDNGAGYTSFDFQINNGKSAVAVLAGEPNAYTLNGGALTPTDQILADSGNFGIGGTYSSNISIISTSSTIDAAYLAQGSILFNGYVRDGAWTATELAALDTWIQNGGILISNSDSAGYDDVSTAYGLTIGGNASTTWHVSDDTSPIMNGPFGLVGTNGSPFSAAGAISYFDSGSLAVGDQVLATDSVSGEPTIVLRQHGTGWILFTSDEGIFRAGMTGGGTIATANDILAANIFAWAADSIPASESYTMAVNVDAVNDDPVNNGTLPAAFSTTEDTPGAVDLSAIDLQDVDSATGNLTMTLTTSAGGTLSAIGSGGVSVTGSGSTTLTLTGTTADLNTFVNNTTGISFTGSLNTSGTGADSIRVDVTDNGNNGAGGGGTISFGTVPVNISAVNDTPVNTVPGARTTPEETQVAITGISVSDVDAAAVSTRLQVASGLLNVTLSGSASISAGSNNSGSVTIFGSLADVNATLASLRYTPNADVTGSPADTLTITTNDGGGSGTGGPLQDVDTVQINVTNINDEEAVTTNTGLTVSEGDTGTAITRLMLETSDIDNTPDQLIYTLSSVPAPATGTLRLNGTALNVSDTFSQNDINLGLVTYDHSGTEVFADSFSFSVNDGSGTSTAGTFAITVTAVNDNDPVITSDGGAATATQTIAENTTAVTTVTATDSDLPAQTLTFSIFGGTDASRFTVDSVNGNLSFSTAPDFEATADADGNNVYEVIVEVSDGQGRFDRQTIQVTITDVDEFDISSVSDADTAVNSVLENSPVGTSVEISVFATDADGTDSVSYSLDDSAGGLFAINSVTGAVTVAGALDRETAAAHTITARATSTDGSSATQSFTITVNDADEFDATAVVDTDGSINHINENTAIGTNVGITAFSQDLDATTNTITYSLDDSAGGLFTIDSTTGVVTTAAAINYEATGSSQNIVVRATSADTSTTTRSFTITISDLDEFDVSPIADTNAAADAISENTAIGTNVGITAFSQDADGTSNAITYSLDDSAGGLFTIDSATGVVATAAAIDYEVTGGSQNIVVRATSADTSTTTRSFTIAISDVDEFDVTPIADTNAAAEIINENTAIGTNVGITAFSQDLDATTNTITYSLDNSAGGLFTIDSTTGVVTTAAAINYEATGSSQNIVVRATSADTSTTTRSFTITISDLDEFDVTPIADTNAVAEIISENTAIGTNVGITAFSQDADGTSNAITYSLDDSAGGLFTIDSATGVVATAAAIDYEVTGGSQNIVVRATSADTSTTTRSFTISISDLNDNAPIIAAAQSFSLSEFAAIGTSVGHVLATDADTVGLLQNWTIAAGNSDGVFAVNPATGEITATDITNLNFETTSSYTLTLTVGDGINTSASQTITIDIVDENDTPIFNTAVPMNINENSGVGSVVGSVSAADEDAADTLSYHIVSGFPGQPFAINGATGVITVADTSQLDFETVTGYSLTLDVRDPGGLTDTQVVTISVNDVNEAPTDIALTGGTVNENSGAGTTVGSVAGTDSDAGDSLTWTLTDTAGGRFAVDENSGLLTVADGSLLDFESNTSHSITVLTTDAGGLTYHESFTITVNDVNEAPTAADDEFSGNQLETLTVPAGGLTVNDFDVDGDAISTVLLLIGPEHGTLVLNADGSFVYTPDDSFSGPDQFTYHVTDGLLNSASATVELEIQITITGGPTGSSGGTDNTSERSESETESESDNDADSSEDNGESDADDSDAANVNGQRAGSDSRSTAGGEIGPPDSSQQILQQTSSQMFITVFLDDVPENQVSTDFRRDGRSEGPNSQNGGHATSEFLFTHITTANPFFAGTLEERTWGNNPREELFAEMVMEKVVIGSTAAVSTSVSVGIHRVDAARRLAADNIPVIASGMAGVRPASGPRIIRQRWRR